jgi:hypothetical protein
MPMQNSKKADSHTMMLVPVGSMALERRSADHDSRKNSTGAG